jgi:protein-S-isoprenylcysteine O-methyltransferase Ste14
MKVWRKTLEVSGYAVNSGSILMFIYLVSTFEITDGLRSLRYIGWVLIIFGFSLMVLSILSLFRNKGAGLIEGGVYGIVRHPMYLGAMLCFLSFVFFFPHWLSPFISSADIAIIFWFILEEEKQDRIRFGKVYEQYVKTVPGINLSAGIYRRLRSKRCPD